jgi:bifunctional DNA-binding transcriptional regulator/antitoxin component of YhaV-PrlF toxin-antitoxin module
MPLTKVDDMGRVLLPSDLRQGVVLKQGDELDLYNRTRNESYRGGNATTMPGLIELADPSAKLTSA